MDILISSASPICLCLLFFVFSESPFVSLVPRFSDTELAELDEVREFRADIDAFPTVSVFWHKDGVPLNGNSAEMTAGLYQITDTKWASNWTHNFMLLLNCLICYSVCRSNRFSINMYNVVKFPSEVNGGHFASCQIPECVDIDPCKGWGQWQLHGPGGERQPEQQLQFLAPGQRLAEPETLSDVTDTSFLIHTPPFLSLFLRHTYTHTEDICTSSERGQALGIVKLMVEGRFFWAAFLNTISKKCLKSTP